MDKDALKAKRRPFRDTQLDAVKPSSAMFRVHNQDNIYFRVRPNGKKDWQLSYKRLDGKWGWLGLGAYPRTTWLAAKKKATEYLGQLQKGEAPQTPRQQAVDNRERAAFTFSARVEAWRLAKTGNVAVSTLKKNMRRLEMYVLPTMGERAIDGIKRAEWLELFNNIAKDGDKAETADRVRQVVREVYDFAIASEVIEANPIEKLRQFLPQAKGENYKWVPIHEMPQLLRDIRAYSGAPDVRLGLFLMSRLGLRTGPVRYAEWREIDWQNQIWVIPGPHMKMERDIVIPLPTQAMEALRELWELTGYNKLMFPGRNDPLKPRADTVFLRALYLMGYKGRQTGHGFRHQFSTICHEAGHNTLAIEFQLAHKDGSIRGVYNAATYLEQRRELMQWYADKLDEMEAGDA